MKKKSETNKNISIKNQKNTQTSRYSNKLFEKSKIHKTNKKRPFLFDFNFNSSSFLQLKEAQIDFVHL